MNSYSFRTVTLRSQRILWSLVKPMATSPITMLVPAMIKVALNSRITGLWEMDFQVLYYWESMIFCNPFWSISSNSVLLTFTRS